MISVAKKILDTGLGERIHHMVLTRRSSSSTVKSMSLGLVTNRVNCLESREYVACRSRNGIQPPDVPQASHVVTNNNLVSPKLSNTAVGSCTIESVLTLMDRSGSVWDFFDQYSDVGEREFGWFSGTATSHGLVGLQAHWVDPKA